MLMAYEATSDLAVEDVTVDTPLERTVGHRVSGKKLTLVPILRAGLGMVEGVYRIMPGARVGHIGLYRDHDTLEPVDYYFKVPERCGGSRLSSCSIRCSPRAAARLPVVSSLLKRAGATRIRFMCLVAVSEECVGSRRHTPT